ncbi:dermonecrotic toxin domain-containing protein [Pseudomonas sp. NUPR-001]|uniref:dermonecrotic toxin domain-containing protein n=1 Tax=Pseudomonas sp. NUPR-001 TaxID=3416058 RepID=UPI003F96E347
MHIPHLNTAGVQYVRNHLATLPRPDRKAKQVIADWLVSQGVNQDPDQIDVVTLHLHPQAPTGYQAQVVQRLSLTQAVITNWQGESSSDVFGGLFKRPWAGTLPDNGPITIVDQLPTPPFYDNSTRYLVFNGLFKRTEPALYDHSTLINIRAEALQSHIESLDFHTLYKASLDTYWSEQLTSYRQCCKLNFIAACNKQAAEGSLGDAARKLAWRAAGLIPRGKGLRLSTLSIYGYAATDLLYINDASSDLTLLYAPGNSSPLLEFASENLLKDWIAEQCKDAAKRKALKQHFRLADGPQGIEFSGLDTALEGLGEYPKSHRLPPEHGFFNDDGRWPPRTYVNYRPGKYNPKITGDLFLALAQRQRQRCYDDADFLITSNAEVTKSRWVGYLNTTLNIVAPLTFVVPGLAPLLALGGIAQMGLGLDQAINGKTLKAKEEGVGNLVWGLLNAAPAAAHAVSRGAKLFTFKSARFVSPSRVNEQWGYPLSPINPPRLPELDVAPYFDAAAAPAVELPETEHFPVERTVDWEKKSQSITGKFAKGGYLVELDLIYDIELDLFVETSDLNSLEPKTYEARQGDILMRRVQPGTRPVTDEMRMATLRRLGVDLQLPVQVPNLPADVRPIPKRISSLWIGDKPIPPELLENLARNTNRLTDTQYQYRLFLSNAHPHIYEQNLRQLAEKAPNLKVETLEQQPFFSTFKDSKFYAQYQDALDGNGGVATNYSSASDVLRYPLLSAEGGLYMDVDDELLQAGEQYPGCVGFGPCTAQALDTVELATTNEGLLFHPPVSNQLLDMEHEFNTSLIGSHPGNPTLDAISEKIHERYQQDPEFYQSRPDREQDPAAFHDYTRRLSKLTGPGMLNDAIDQTLPQLSQMRQLERLFKLPLINGRTFVDLDRWILAQQELMPLNRIARIGGAQSWTTH